MEYNDIIKRKRNFIAAIFIGLILALVILGYIAYFNKLSSENIINGTEIQDMIDN